MANESENGGPVQSGKPDHEKTYEIKIDRTNYKIVQEQITGAELRQVPQPPIAVNLDLYEVVPGGSDLKIEMAMVVQIKNGMRFFTAPAQINPGMW